MTQYRVLKGAHRKNTDYTLKKKILVNVLLYVKNH